MNKIIVPLFSTPIFMSKIDVDDSIFQSSLDYVKSLDYMKCVDCNGNNNGNISKEQSLLEDVNLLSLRKCIESEIEIYLYEFLKLNKDIKIKHLSSWAVKHQYGDKCDSHKHSNSLFSGVLYLKVPENSGNKLIFENYYTNNCIQLNFSEYNYLNSNEWQFDVTEKSIIIFPSEVHHKAPISKSKLDRYCISFNYFISGKIGYNTTYAHF